MEKVEISSRKLEIPREHFMRRWGIIKDRNGRDLTKQKILRSGGKNTQKIYTKKDLNDPYNHDGVITHLEPDILEWEVKWALGSTATNKVSGGDGIPVELFQILKDDPVKVLHSICQQIWKTKQWPQEWKRSVFIPITKKGNAKECSNYHTVALISHTSKAMLKILQTRLQHYVNRELQDVLAGFRKGRGTRDQIASTHCRKTSTSALLTMPKPLTVWITTNCGKFFKWWEHQTTLPASWEICMQVKKQQLELDMEQWIGSKLRTEYSQGLLIMVTLLI